MKVHEFMHEMATTSAVLGRSSNVSVVFEGTEAKTDGKTIYLPSLPQQKDLTPEQVMAMRGYVDHEAGHNRHSDMRRIVSFYDKNHHNKREELSKIHNALEDTWMEDKVLEEYPGAWKNLKQVNELVRHRELQNIEKQGTDLVKAGIEADPNDRAFCSIMWNKNEDFNTDTNQKCRDLLTDKANEMGQHWNKLARECKSTDEIIELAKKVYQYVEQTGAEDQSPEDFDQKADNGELSDLEGEENEGENSPEFRDGDGTGEGREAAGKAQAAGQESGSGEKKAAVEPTDIGECLEEAGDGTPGGIGSCIDEGLRGGYTVATTASDIVYKRGAPKPPHASHENYTIVNDTTSFPKYDQRKTQLKSNIMTMKNKLRRSLMARQQRDWDFGREFGRLDSKRLVAASQGVKQVWKRRTDREDHDTVVTILVDLSGSMYGEKVKTARDCAIALSECFEGTQIKYKIVGFSNNGGSGAWGRRHSGGGKYHRYERLDTTIFKDFDEPLRIARGSVYLIEDAVGGNNSDYDFVDAELFHLSRRPEKRKVLFVFSDGYVACASSAPTSEHQRLIKENLKHYKKQYGVESVGIGIQSDAVRHIYPDQVVIDNVSELSGTVFNMMTNILFRDMKR